MRRELAVGCPHPSALVQATIAAVEWQVAIRTVGEPVRPAHAQRIIHVIVKRAANELKPHDRIMKLRAKRRLGDPARSKLVGPLGGG